MSLICFISYCSTAINDVTVCCGGYVISCREDHQLSWVEFNYIKLNLADLTWREEERNALKKKKKKSLCAGVYLHVVVPSSAQNVHLRSSQQAENLPASSQTSDSTDGWMKQLVRMAQSPSLSLSPHTHTHTHTHTHAHIRRSRLSLCINLPVNASVACWFWGRRGGRTRGWWVKWVAHLITKR